MYSAIVVSTCLWTAPAFAEPPRTPPAPLAQALKGDARVLYDSARDLFKAGDYASAYAKFQRALELSNDPRLLWNMAACERKAKHNANVLRLIEQYLKDGEGWLGDEDKQEAARAASAVRAFVASAKVSTSPADGVEIFVDDVRVAVTPIDKPIWVDAGPRRVRFAKAGLRMVERSEDIPAGAELAWSIDLEKGDKKGTAGGAAVAPPPRDGASRPFPWGPAILGGAGVVLAATGGVLVFVTASEFGSLRDECGTSCDRARWEGSRDTQVVGDVLLVVGGAAIAGAVLWWVLTPNKPKTLTGSAPGFTF